MPNATVTLDKPIITHDGELRSLVVREPGYREIMEAGMPYQVHTTDEGQSVVIYNQPAIRFYTEACLVTPKESDMLVQLGLTDTLKLREAILRFFLSPASEDAGSTTSPKTSGSSAVSAPTPLAA